MGTQRRKGGKRGAWVLALNGASGLLLIDNSLAAISTSCLSWLTIEQTNIYTSLSLIIAYPEETWAVHLDTPVSDVATSQ